MSPSSAAGNVLPLVKESGLASAAGSIFGKRLAPDDSLIADNFIAWFGASKVLDAAGGPLRLFHSTFDSFESFGRTSDIGFHFGSTSVAHKRITDTLVGRGRGDDRCVGLNVLPVYLKIANPFVLDSDPIAWNPDYLLKQFLSVLGRDTVQQLLDMEEHCVSLARTAAAKMKSDAAAGLKVLGVIRRNPRYNGEPVTYDLLARRWNKMLAESRTELWPAISAALQVVGFDGLSYPNEVEGLGRTKAIRAQDPANLTWVAFRPEQIKSAVGNSGAFDSQSPDLADQQAWDSPGEEFTERERMRA